MLLDAARWSRKFLQLTTCSPSSARITNFGVGATYDISIIPTVCSTTCNALNAGGWSGAEGDRRRRPPGSGGRSVETSRFDLAEPLERKRHLAEMEPALRSRSELARVARTCAAVTLPTCTCCPNLHYGHAPNLHVRHLERSRMKQSFPAFLKVTLSLDPTDQH